MGGSSRALAVDTWSAADWRRVLEPLGFRANRSGTAYRRHGLVLVPGRGWCTLVTRTSDSADPLSGPLGKPGLWKLVGGEQRGVHEEFHLPLSMLTAGDAWGETAEGTSTPLSACVDWAAATAQGTLPAGWECPPREALECWVSNAGLVLQSGPFALQGSLVSTPERLALRLPVVAALPRELSAARRRWLEAIIAHTQDRWRMVRIGLAEAGERQSVEAEVDLSGAPRSILEGGRLLKFSLDALRWVVSWLMWPAGFLADSGVACHAWEAMEPERGTPRMKEVCDE